MVVDCPIFSNPGIGVFSAFDFVTAAYRLHREYKTPLHRAATRAREGLSPQSGAPQFEDDVHACARQPIADMLNETVTPPVNTSMNVHVRPYKFKSVDVLNCNKMQTSNVQTCTDI